ncbi:MAG: hypothetical protein AABX11_04945 [Nanoarchaeota archaeon]
MSQDKSTDKPLICRPPYKNPYFILGTLTLSIGVSYTFGTVDINNQRISTACTEFGGNTNKTSVIQQAHYLHKQQVYSTNKTCREITDFAEGKLSRAINYFLDKNLFVKE